MDFGVITFTSTYGAIYAQKVLRPVADVLTIPVLREISLGCGIAVRFRPEDGAAVHAALFFSALRPDENTPFTVLLRGGPARPSRWTVGAARRSKIQPMSRDRGKGHDGGHEVFPACGLVEQGLDEQHHARGLAAARAAGHERQQEGAAGGNLHRNRMTGMRITAARQMMPSVNSVTMESVRCCSVLSCFPINLKQYV
ncbi:MAG: DUF3343 domain-containing protein, partial [Flavonifractor plautii]